MISTELLELIVAAEEKAAGKESALFVKNSLQDMDLNRISHKGFTGDLAYQILARKKKADWDYVTPAGGVISNIYFPFDGERGEEMIIDGRGRTDLPLDRLPEVVLDTMVRPKLPGQQMTRKEVQALGRRTCYEVVERVGDTLFGLYPIMECGCCTYNAPRPLSSLILEDWHEGIMVFLDGVEYRARNYFTKDEYDGDVLWEYEQRDSWIKVKPRGSNKKPSPPKPQVTVPMVLAIKSRPRIPSVRRRWMSKAAVQGRGGWVFYLQDSGWDLIGGKSEATDADHYQTMRREYKEETSLDPPGMLY